VLVLLVYYYYNTLLLLLVVVVVVVVVVVNSAKESPVPTGWEAGWAPVPGFGEGILFYYIIIILYYYYNTLLLLVVEVVVLNSAKESPVPTGWAPVPGFGEGIRTLPVLAIQVFRESSTKNCVRNTAQSHSLVTKLTELLRFPLFGIRPAASFLRFKCPSTLFSNCAVSL
jgi:hypothetical protein